LSLDPATVWLVILGMSVVTVSLRMSLLVLPPGVQLPPSLRHALRFVPAAALTAIWAPELFLQKGALYLSFENERLLAGIVAIAVAWRWRHTYVTIFAGLAALHLFSWMIRELRVQDLL